MQEEAQPETIAATAERLGCRSVAFTYNDPVIFHEYAADIAAACREHGVKTVAVTAGYLTDRARADFFRGIDAANVDLKAFTEDFYWTITKGHLQPVLDTLLYLKHETDIWFEITSLVIPGENDSEGEINAMCAWVVDNLGPDVPIHFSAFHPDYRMLDKPRTPFDTLALARRAARGAAQRRALRLHRQRPRPRPPIDLLPCLRHADHRSRLVRAFRLATGRARRVHRLRYRDGRRLRRPAGALGQKATAGVPGLTARA